MTIEEEGYPSIELQSFGNAPSYYAAILKYFAPYLVDQVVEVGAGFGTFSQCLRKPTQKNPCRSPQNKSIKLLGV